MKVKSEKPISRIDVLLATHNGQRWLPAQLESILGQVDVSVRVWISDDNSTDGTLEWLKEQAKTETRIRLLPNGQRYGSAAKNFYRLIREANWQDADYVAFADQDDIWNSDKLKRHSVLMREKNLIGISSNVEAFWANNRQKMIIKSQRQTNWDFVFESAGPGCTYLMSPRLLSNAKSLLLDVNNVASECALHDWLMYGLARSMGGRWYIDTAVTVAYRQHELNEFGANVGIKPLMSRLAKIFNGWHRKEAIKICMSIRSNANTDSVRRGLEALITLLINDSFYNRFRLIRYSARGRRKSSDRLVLSLLIFLGLW
ncbi:MAG: glycosyltransferase [Sideroxydans sp.]|nr:glycosyltransferase [Sideroxydans sp.]